MAKNNLGEIKVDLKINTEEIIADLKKVQREAKKATQEMRKLQVIQENKTEFEELLSLAGKHGFLLTAMTNESRGEGKTHALVKKALKENLAILVSCGSAGQSLLESYGFNNYFSAINIELLDENFSRFDGFLVDDLVRTEQIKKFTEHSGLEFKGGFTISKHCKLVMLNKE